MKKLISLTAAVLLLFSLVSCKEKNREYDEKEVKTAAEKLIFESGELNGVLWGEGLEYDAESRFKNGFYCPATDVALEKLGISDLDGLKEKCAGVFSSAYCDSIYNTVFSSFGDDDSVLGYARYYQGEGFIMVFSKANVLLKDRVEYLFDTLSVKGAEGEKVFVTLSVKVTRGDKFQIQTVDIGLIEEADGWRIDTPTYLVYNEFLEN